MKLRNKKSLIATLISSSLLVAGAASADEKISVIVKLKDIATPFSLQKSHLAKSTNYSAKQIHLLQAQQRQQKLQQFVNLNNLKAKHIYSNVYNGFSTHLSQSEIDELKANPNVAAIYRDEIFYINDSNNLTSSNKHKSKNKPQRTVKRKRKLIDWPQVTPQGPADSGAAELSYRGAGQHVYVLDTGVDTRQNDIKENLGLGYAPEFCHWPADNKLCPMPYSDDHGHGTHVAGTIAAQDNAINSLGMAPAATIHPVKICTKEGSCPSSSILAGLNWAVFDMLGRGESAVANLSIGGATELEAGNCNELGYEGDNFVAESYCNAAHQGMVIVVAAGNSSADAAGYSPAGFNSTITVSSYTEYDSFSGEALYTGFSNYGDGENSWSDRKSGVITIAAPGNLIMSLNRTHANRVMSGTSMASPATAGAAALVMEKYPQSLDFSALQNVRQLLVDNASIPAFYTTEPDDDGNPQDFPHEEGILNVRFLQD
ncbi:S8 family serine peptidase [Aliikangiella sp. IMCC44653]